MLALRAIAGRANACQCLLPLDLGQVLADLLDLDAIESEQMADKKPSLDLVIDEM